MSDLIKAISSKQDWQKKIERESLIKKWATELEPQGYSADNLNVAIKVLKTLVNKPRDIKEYLKTFKWDIFHNECNCSCAICGSSVSRRDPNDPVLFAEEDFICKCAMKVIPKRKEFLESLVLRKELISPEVRELLIQEVANLEKLPPDWHPESNEQVLDLVHPSLYCYTEGLTKILDKRLNQTYEKPNVLQWLPAEVSILDGKAKFESEINNLPKSQYPSFYAVLENILTSFLPSLETTMSKHLQELITPPKVILQELITPLKVHPLESLQVIVKLSSTILTPEKPQFPGGNWHLEGHASEHIVATGIYYYQNENIVDSGLYTRIPLREEDEQNLNYEQNEFKGLPVHYLLEPEREQTGIQHLGPVQTNTGDCLIFPNFVQHKVSTFKLADESKPGVRKILLFWIVDPNKRILSTADVEKPSHSMRDAKIYREMLMYQRKNEVDERDMLYETELSLCEH